MLRWIYIQLLWAHPAEFRYRFCDGMLEVFDSSRGLSVRLRLLLDGLLSVLRRPYTFLFFDCFAKTASCFRWFDLAVSACFCDACLLIDFGDLSPMVLSFCHPIQIPRHNPAPSRTP